MNMFYANIVQICWMLLLSKVYLVDAFLSPSNRLVTSSSLDMSSVAVEAEPKVTEKKNVSVKKEVSPSEVKRSYSSLAPRHTKQRRTLKTVNPLRLSPVETEYLTSVALQIGRYQTGNSIVFTAVSKLNPAPLPTKLRQAALKSQSLPQIMSLIFDKPLFSQETLVAENVKTITQNPTSGSYSIDGEALHKVMVERSAYMLLEDLNNIRDGIYPFPSDLAKTLDPLEVIPETIQQIARGLNFAAKDTYSGNVDYESNNNEPSKYLKELSIGVDNLPDYYLNDFHSVPGGFLAPEHPPVYDLVSETVFAGTHFMSRRMMFRPLAEAMKVKGGEGQSLLDLGTGNGSFLIQLQEAFPSLTLTGLDLSPAMLDYAQKSFESSPIMQKSKAPAELLQANMEHIPMSDESFDFVTQSNCFHEMPESAIRNTAAEISRVLKPGGLFVHHDAVQMDDDMSVAATSRATFDRRFNEPFILNFMENVNLDSIFAEHGLHPSCPVKPYRQAAVRCYKKIDQRM